MELLTTVLLLICSALAVYVIRYYRWAAKYPPGPTPIPFFGNALMFRHEYMHDMVPRLAKEYGNIFTLFFHIPVVVITDYEGVKQAFLVQSDEFSNRPIMGDTSDRFCSNPGVISSNGGSWSANRRAAIHILRDFGMGKNLMEEQVKLSIQEYLKFLDNIKDKENVDMRWPIQVMIANIINDTLFGFRYAYDDCEPLVDYVESFNKFIGIVSNPLFLFALSTAFRYLPAFIARRLLSGKSVEQMKQNAFIVENVERAMKTYSKDAEPDCFVHAYNNLIGTNEYLTKEQLLSTCSDFFLAGQETTSTTLRWAMLFLATNQHVQDMIRDEIFTVVGHNRLPSMADKAKMSYTSAAVMEIQRKANIVQTSVNHETSCDTTLMGHHIPKGTRIDGDIHVILSRDPNFENPEEFRPERFLNKDGVTLNKAIVERVIPFGIGKRQCAGEALARVELFLGLTATLQRYRIHPSPTGPVDLSPQPLIIMIPKDQPLRIELIAQ